MSSGFIERRQQTLKAIQNLLDERQQVWSLYAAVAELRPFEDRESLLPRLQEFCQILVDYVSMGHFEIYQLINEGTERRQKVRSVSSEVYPKLVEATDRIVDFNDKYEQLSETLLRRDFDADFAKLGEVLSLRSELEDQLIEAFVA